MKIEKNTVLSKECVQQILAIKDTMELISGK